MKNAKNISVKKLLAVLRNYEYATLDRRDFTVGISFSEKDYTTDEGYVDYNQTMYLAINSIPSMWGSQTEIQFDLEIPFHVTNEGSVQQGEVNKYSVYIWGTEESFKNGYSKLPR